MKRPFVKEEDDEPLLEFFRDHVEIVWENVMRYFPSLEILKFHVTFGQLSKHWHDYVESIPLKIITGTGSEDHILESYMRAMAIHYKRMKDNDPFSSVEIDLTNGKYPTRNGQMALVPLNVSLPAPHSKKSIGTVVILGPLIDVNVYAVYRTTPTLSLMGKHGKVFVSGEEDQALRAAFPPDAQLGFAQPIWHILPMRWFDRAVETLKRRKPRINAGGLFTNRGFESDFRAIYVSHV